MHDDLVQFTHLFPEWKSAESKLKAGASRVKMDYLDFFKPCPEGEYCDADDELVEMNRQVFMVKTVWLTNLRGPSETRA